MGNKACEFLLGKNDYSDFYTVLNNGGSFWTD